MENNLSEEIKKQIDQEAYEIAAFGINPHSDAVLISTAYIAGATRYATIAAELIDLIDTMHKPEYATFFIGQPATDDENQMDGYELAEKYRKILGILEP